MMANVSVSAATTYQLSSLAAEKGSSKKKQKKKTNKQTDPLTSSLPQWVKFPGWKLKTAREHARKQYIGWYCS